MSERLVMRDDVSRAYGFDAYLPLPKEEREGIALCLSGGGYRAALFHLGSLRRLNELGVLSQVATITSVSGGSIMAGQLAGYLAQNRDAWPEPGGSLASFDEGVAAPLRRFTSRNIRTRAVLSRLLPRNWRNVNAQVEALAAAYAEGPAPGLLSDLPERPRFVFCATDMRFRWQWVFDSGRRRVGSDPAGYVGLGPHWTLARAVAASSCLPGAFAPMQLQAELAELAGGSYEGEDRAMLVGSIDLVDGGIFDNLGLEPVWRDHSAVLVSDAAPVLKPNPPFGPLWRWLRIAVTLLEQATDVRKRWLIASFISGELEGAYWSINSLPSNYELDLSHGQQPLEPYPDRLIRDVISQVRIDLDAFSDAEAAVLENHGYLMAEIAVRKHAGSLVATPAPVRPPHPEWLDPARVRSALADSWRTRLFKRAG